jgi:carbamoyltransferase
MSQSVLGISAFYHDSAAALITDGEIVAAAQEERFTRIKQDPSFPVNAIRYVLEESGVDPAKIGQVVFYEKPFIKFERLLETYHAYAPKGLGSFLSAMPVWIKEKLFLKELIRKEMRLLGIRNAVLLFPEHHLSHAASAFYPSPYHEAAILTIDGVGEWATTTMGYGVGNQVSILRELHFPHSVGLLYSAFTYYTGFQVNEGEYKLMGLAPFGDRNSGQYQSLREKITGEMVSLQEDGSVILNMKYFSYATGLRMTNNKRWQRLLGFPPRKPDAEITQDYMNLALIIQDITEEIVIRLSAALKRLVPSKNLVIAGGVGLNCVANGRLLKTGLFENIWIQPAAGDAGGALGAAYAGYHIGLGRARHVNLAGDMIARERDAMKGALLGPEFSDKQILNVIKRENLSFTYFDDFDTLCEITSEKLDEGSVVGWFQGRMEFGPRALGNRSILGDARNPDIQRTMNLKIKFREGFRPFAPSVMEEDMHLFFEMDRPSPYMLMTAGVLSHRRINLPEHFMQMPLMDRVHLNRSDIPAVTHIDYSARIQSVDRETNPRYWKLLNAFKARTGIGLLVNTSFNVKGEPIVCTPDDACRCFLRTGIDFLVMGNYFIEKPGHSRPV